MAASLRKTPSPDGPTHVVEAAQLAQLAFLGPPSSAYPTDPDKFVFVRVAGGFSPKYVSAPGGCVGCRGAGGGDVGRGNRDKEGAEEMRGNEGRKLKGSRGRRPPAGWQCPRGGTGETAPWGQCAW